MKWQKIVPIALSLAIGFCIHQGIWASSWTTNWKWFAEGLILSVVFLYWVPVFIGGDI